MFILNSLFVDDVVVCLPNVRGSVDSNKIRFLIWFECIAIAGKDFMPWSLGPEWFSIRESLVELLQASGGKSPIYYRSLTGGRSHTQLSFLPLTIL